VLELLTKRQPGRKPGSNPLAADRLFPAEL